MPVSAEVLRRLTFIPDGRRKQVSLERFAAEEG